MAPKCIACGHTDLIRDVAVIDYAENYSQFRLTLKTYKRPDALVFKGSRKAEAYANVCPACGYVMLYTQSAGGGGPLRAARMKRYAGDPGKIPADHPILLAIFDPSGHSF